MNDDALAKIAHLLDHYEPSPSAIQLVQSTPILLLVGISGAGKDTTRRQLLSETEAYHPIISHTTRKPRMNDGEIEQEGVEYHFIDLERAKDMLEQGQYVEAKLYSDNVYGTSVDEIAAANREGKIAVADVEVQGVAEYKALNPNVLAVYLLPPSYKVWLQRLQARYAGHEIDQADMRRRMETAVYELEHALSTDYFSFVVNDDLDDTVHLVDRLAHNKVPELEAAENKALANGLLQSIKTHLKNSWHS